MLLRRHREQVRPRHGLGPGPAGQGRQRADIDNTLWQQPESAGLNAVAEGFRHLGFKDDHTLNAAEWIVYDALYAYCREMVRQGKHNGDFVGSAP